MRRKGVLQEASQGQCPSMHLLFRQAPCHIHTHKAQPWATQATQLQLLASQARDSMVTYHSLLEVAITTAGCICIPWQGRTGFPTAPMQACCRRGVWTAMPMVMSALAVWSAQQEESAQRAF